MRPRKPTRHTLFCSTKGSPACSKHVTPTPLLRHTPHDTRRAPRQSKKLKEVEASRFQLAEGAKRVDAKRRELMRQSEHQLVRVEALEKELDRQLGISDEQRRKVSEAGAAASFLSRWCDRVAARRPAAALQLCKNKQACV